MPNLFPEDFDFETDIADAVQREDNRIEDYKSSYAFDFEKGDFKRGVDGKILIVDRLEAYMQWCQKTLLTKRYRHLAYTPAYGQEYHTLIGEGLDKGAVELEVERMTIEALNVHPYTKEVSNFKFKWDSNKSELIFDFDVITVLDELFTLNSATEMR